jgi:hypothetical protein
MTITRHDWRINGDLLEWLATEFPSLSRAQFEAGYRLLARLAGWVSKNPRHQGFAAKTLPELDALAEPTGADA